MQPIFRKGVSYNPAGDVVNCIFCRISNHDPNIPANVVLDSNDGKFISFVPLDSVTNCHVLISPKSHVQNLDSLVKRSDAQLVKEMVAFGKQALLKHSDNKINPNNPLEAIYCFHVPPWNSIDHLHLHVIGRPNEMSFKSWIKYFQNGYWCKSADTLIKELEALPY